MDEFVRQTRKGIGLQLQTMQRCGSGIGKREPQKPRFRSRQGQMVLCAACVRHPTQQRPCIAIIGAMHFKTSRHARLGPFNEQTAKSMPPSKINHPPRFGICLIRLPAGIIFIGQHRCRISATRCRDIQRQVQRLILNPRIANFQHATPAGCRGHHKLHGADRSCRAATGRTPRKGQVALTYPQSQPLASQDQAFTPMSPNIDARPIGQLELKIIRRTRALEIETQLVCLRHRKCQLTPQSHKSATFVEIVLKFQASTLAAAHPPLRMARSKDLPCFNVFKQRTNGFLSSHGDLPQAKPSSKGNHHRFADPSNQTTCKIPFGWYFLFKSLLRRDGDFDMTGGE